MEIGLDLEIRGIDENMSITDHNTDATMERVSDLNSLDIHNEILNEIVENESKEIKNESADERNKYKHKKSTRMSRKRDYTCYKCDKPFTSLGVLQRHIKIVHEGIRYPCKLCGLQSTTQTDLKRHIKAKHIEDETLIFT